MTTHHRPSRPLACIVVLLLATAIPLIPDRAADAQARVRRSYARASVHRSSSVDVHRQINVDVHDDHHYDRWGHPVAAAAAFTAAAVAVGTVVASLPPRCSTVVVGAVTYHNCGGVYYQPVYHSTAVQYVVVDHP